VAVVRHGADAVRHSVPHSLLIGPQLIQVWADFSLRLRVLQRVADGARWIGLLCKNQLPLLRALRIRARRTEQDQHSKTDARQERHGWILRCKGEWAGPARAAEPALWIRRRSR